MNKELMTIPGIGKSLSADLESVGIHKVDDLRGKNPFHLYQKLNRQTNTTMDKCVLYAFRCAVYFAQNRNNNPDPDLLKWWNWKNRNINE